MENANINKCKNCGSEMLFTKYASTLKCEYCGSVYNLTPEQENNLPDVDSEMQRYINLHRKLAAENNKFINEKGEFKHSASLLNEKPTDS